MATVKQEDDSDLEAAEEQHIPMAASTHAAPENHGEHVHQRVNEQPTNPRPIIPFDENQASATSYPPGCPVLHVNTSATPPIVTIGQTQSVAFNIATNGLQFCVMPAHGGDAIVSSESQLQYAPLCRVEATVNDDSGPTKKKGFVVTSYQPSPNSVAMYSVQEDGAGGSIFHGIPKGLITYRPNVASGVEPRGRVEMNASHSGAHSVHSASNQSASNGTNSSAKRAIVKTRKVSPDVPYKRRKSNEGVSIASHSQNEAMNRELCTKRKSRSSGRLTNPEQSKREQSPTAKRGIERDFSPVNKTSITSRARNGDQRDSNSTRFVIPSCSFRVDTMKEFFKENGDAIERETNCGIRFNALRQSSSRGNDRFNMHLEVNGTPDDVYRAIIAIERLLIRTLCYEEQGRALYYMALLNEHRRKNANHNIVRQFCCHFVKEEMKYMYAKRLPENYENIIGICIGKNGSRKKKIENNTECKIDINLKDTQHAHYVVYGDNEEDVVECTRQIEGVLKEATDIKRAEYSLQS